MHVIQGVIPNTYVFWVHGLGTGDPVEVATLPPPYNSLPPSKWGPGKAGFMWVFGEKLFGYGNFNVNEQGAGKFDFSYSNSASGMSGFLVGLLKARVDMIGDDGQILKSIRSQVQPSTAHEPFEFGDTEVGSGGIFDVSNSVQWWKSVKTLTFYHGPQAF